MNKTEKHKEELESLRKVQTNIYCEILGEADARLAVLKVFLNNILTAGVCERDERSNEMYTFQSLECREIT